MDIVVLEKLERSFYIRSKISYYPLSQNIAPVPEGLSVVVFETKQDIEQYFQMRGVTDPENFEILPISSFYDFMQEVAGMGFIGIWFFKNFPIMFGNYVSEIDIDLPSFCYTYNNDFIGASGLIEEPAKYIPWKNYFRTDKIIRRFVRYVHGVPFLPADGLYTIVRNFDSIQGVSAEAKDEANRYCIFSSGSPLQGPYVSDIGVYALFTEKDAAEQYLAGGEGGAVENFKVERVENVHTFLNSVAENFPFVHIGVNPSSERYLQGYFLFVEDKWYVKTVLGVYALTDDLTLEEVTEDITLNEYKDTVNRANSVDATLRGISTTIKNPLKHLKGTTSSKIPRREALRLLEKLIDGSDYKKGFEHAGDAVQPSDITSDSFLVFAFDKVTGQHFTNNEELIAPFVFPDVIDAILYFYHLHLMMEYELRRDGFYYCAGNKHYAGSNDEQLENYILAEQRTAFEELLEMILVDGYSIEHSELLKSYLNRISVSLEIEECGYLGDLSIYKKPYMDEQLEEDEDLPIQDRVFKLSNAYSNRLASKIELDEKYQSRIRIYLGSSYNNLSMESLCILESAMKQFEATTQHINHDYAGISMKLCKVFERELQIMILNRWKQQLNGKFTKQHLKSIKHDAGKAHDLTTSKLTGWLLKKNKLELGPMGFIFKRIASNCDNELLADLGEFISSYENANFLKSDSLQEAIKQISTRYRNGGVHEKIVTYEICNEAFDRILTSENSYLRQLATF